MTITNQIFPIMKQFALILLTVFISFISTAQDKSTAATLISEGIKLNDEGKYDEAMAKYKEVLQTEPNNANANYEIAFTLFSTNKGKDAIPYLNKITELKSPVIVKAYDMLGSIYDMDNQGEKAIEYFKLGIKADPNYQRIYFNLAITYGRQGKYPEAMDYAAKALELDPGHASAHRVYAIMAASTGQDVKAIYAYSNFLLLEATSERSAAAYKELKTLLAGGLTQKDGVNNITISNDKDADMNAASMLVSMSGISTGAIPGLSETEKFEAQLKTIFSTTGGLSAKKKEKDFFWSYYADYFAKLSKTEFMPVVVQMMSFTTNNEENTKWFKEHEQQLKDFTKWQQETPHK